MEYHFDSEISLQSESEHPSLYTWSLAELTNDPKQRPINLIPWQSKLFFTSSEIIFQRSIGGHLVGLSTDRKSEPSTHEETIRAQFDLSDRKDPLENEQFSMLGTNRGIKKIGLRIVPHAVVESEENCTSHGWVSSTSEFDVDDETSEDVLTFDLNLTRATFDFLADGISLFGMNLLMFSVKEVSGFYSEWSPGITTDYVKILTNGNEHKVIDKDLVGIVPPRLGRVGGWDVNLRKRVRPDGRNQW